MPDITNEELAIILRMQDKASKKLKSAMDGTSKTTKENTKKMNKSFDAVRKNAAQMVAAFLLIRRTARGMKEAVGDFAEFEKGIANVAILLDRNVIPATAVFTRGIDQLSTTMGVASKELTKGLFDIQSATGDTAGAMKKLTAATRLAESGGSTLVDTTSGLLTLMENYGPALRDAADGADLLFKAQVGARATIGELSEASGVFLSLASDLKIDVNELFAVFIQLTRALGNVNLAATSLNALVNALLKPTPALTARMQEWFQATSQQAVAEHGLIAVLEKLQGVSKEELGSLVQRRQAIRAVTGSTRDLNFVKQQAIDLSDRQGIVDERLLLQLATTQKQLDITREKWESMNRAVGDALVNVGAVGVAQRLLDGIAERVKTVAFLAKNANEEGFISWQGQIKMAAGVMLDPFIGAMVASNVLSKELTDELVKQNEEYQRQKQTLEDHPVLGPELPTAVDAMALRTEAMRDLWNQHDLRVQESMDFFRAITDETYLQDRLASEQWIEDRQLLVNTMAENWKLANESMLAMSIRFGTAFQQNLGTAIKDVILGAKSAKEAVKQLGEQMLAMIVEYLVRRALAFVATQALQATILATQTAMAAATASAWAPAAAMVSLATFGANAAPAMAGMAQTNAFAAILSAAKPAAKGLLVDRPTNVLAGEGGEPEVIAPVRSFLNSIERGIATGMGGGRGQVMLITQSITIEKAVLSDPNNISDFVEELNEMQAFDTEFIKGRP